MITLLGLPSIPTRLSEDPEEEEADRFWDSSVSTKRLRPPVHSATEVFPSGRTETLLCGCTGVEASVEMIQSKNLSAYEG